MRLFECFSSVARVKAGCCEFRGLLTAASLAATSQPNTKMMVRSNGQETQVAAQESLENICDLPRSPLR